MSIHLVATAVFFVMVNSASAALILQINANNEEFALIGSDSVTTDGSLDAVSWALSTPISVNESVSYDNDVAYTLATGSPEVVGSYDTNLNFNNTFGIFILNLRFNDSPNTVTGTGVFQSYSSLDSSNKAILGSLDGQTLGTLNGSSSSLVTVSVIPEPSSAWLLIVGFGALLISRRGRRRIAGSEG